MRPRWFQGLWRAKSVVTTPVFPCAQVEVCRANTPWLRGRGEQRGDLGWVVPRVGVIAIASAVPVGGRGEETMIPRRPEMVPAERANEVVARGQCHGPTRWFRDEEREQLRSCLGGHGAGTGCAGRAEQALPRAGSVPGCATRFWSRPPWCLRVSWRGSRGGSGLAVREGGSRAPAHQRGVLELSLAVVSRARVHRWAVTEEGEDACAVGLRKEVVAPAAQLGRLS